MPSAKKPTPSYSLKVIDLGLINYVDALKQQEHYWKELFQQKKTRLGTLIVNQHPSTITLGRREKGAGILATNATLKRLKVEKFAINRGGLTTLHSPGQIVVYPIVPLKSWRVSVKNYVAALELAMTQTCLAYQVEASPGSQTGRPIGAWVNESKIGQIGIAVKRGITQHGLALNVENDLKLFELINPCGLRSGLGNKLDEGITITSLHQELSQQHLPLPALEKVQKTLIDNLANNLHVGLE
jgi:lipoyl(octanoyl) transferase